MTRLITFLLCCLCPAMMVMSITINAHSNSFYVDYVGGSDANNGTSTSTPWQHCPGDPAATSTPASATLNPGDTIFFHGGDRYVLTGTTGIIPANGTPGNPVTYDGNSAGTWGTGRTIVTDNYGTHQAAAFGSATYMSNVVIDAFEIGPLGGGTNGGANVTPTNTAAAPNPAYGVDAETAFINVTIANCYLHDIGYWYNGIPMDAGSIAGNGIYTTGCSHLTITNCEFTKINYCIEVPAATSELNLLVTNCYFHGPMVFVIDLSMTSGSITRSNILIYGSRFYDFSDYYTVWTGFGGLGMGPHQDLLYDRAGTLPTGSTWTDTNIIFANNLAWDDTGNDAVQAEFWCDSTPTASIIGNVFNGLHPNGVFVVTCTTNNPGAYYCYNNTFGIPQNQDIAASGTGGSDAQHTIWPANATGVFTGNDIYYVAQPFSSGFTIWPSWVANVGFNQVLQADYDCVFGVGATTSTSLFLGTSGANTSFSLLQTYPNFGTTWEAHGIYADPKLANPAANNCQPLTGSPVFGLGTNLTAVFASWGHPELDTDISGVTRPATGAWTSGAYQSAFVAPSVTTLSGHLTLGGNMTIK